jgi:hypothetical protein
MALVSWHGPDGSSDQRLLVSDAIRRFTVRAMSCGQMEQVPGVDERCQDVEVAEPYSRGEGVQ